MKLPEENEFPVMMSVAFCSGVFSMVSVVANSLSVAPPHVRFPVGWRASPLVQVPPVHVTSLISLYASGSENVNCNDSPLQFVPNGCVTASVPLGNNFLSMVAGVILIVS